MSGILRSLQKKWFLVALAVLIPAGLLAERFLTASQLDQVIGAVPPRLVTACILVLMAFSLDSRQLGASFRAPAPVMWAVSINYAFIPLLGWALMPVQLLPDFSYGLMIAASVPCTLAAASVWTRKAKGNDAVSLLVTLVTNTLCFAVTPVWLRWATSAEVALDAIDMMYRLILVVLLPTMAGQALRAVPPLSRAATVYKVPIGVLAQLGVLSLVFTAACNAGKQLGGDGPNPALGGVLLVWACCIALHVLAMAVAWRGGGYFGFAREDRIAAAIAGSQKTLPVGLYLATDPELFGNPDLLDGAGLPFALFPMLMYHASQLFVDTVVADRLAAGSAAVALPPATTTDAAS